MAIGALSRPSWWGAVVLTMKLGRPQLGSPLLWATGALLMYLAGAAVGVLLPFSGLNLQGTVYEVAQYNLLVLGAVLAGIGGLAYWGPKLGGASRPTYRCGCWPSSACWRWCWSPPPT